MPSLVTFSNFAQFEHPEPKILISNNLFFVLNSLPKNYISAVLVVDKMPHQSFPFLKMLGKNFLDLF